MMNMNIDQLKTLVFSGCEIENNSFWNQGFLLPPYLDFFQHPCEKHQFHRFQPAKNVTSSFRFPNKTALFLAPFWVG